MKVLLSFFLVFIIAIQHTQSQVLDTSNDKTSQESYGYFSLKQKRQKTGAWVCLGAGIAMTIVGLSINSVDEMVEELYLGGLVEVEDVHEGDWLVYLGGATTIASIPLFISAGKNKRKAELRVKNSVSRMKSLQNKKMNHVSVSLTIPF